jgi:hypothetical protein
LNCKIKSISFYFYFKKSGAKIIVRRIQGDSLYKRLVLKSIFHDVVAQWGCGGSVGDVVAQSGMWWLS